jgi:hypothetical protein
MDWRRLVDEGKLLQCATFFAQRLAEQDPKRLVGRLGRRLIIPLWRRDSASLLKAIPSQLTDLVDIVSQLAQQDEGLAAVTDEYVKACESYFHLSVAHQFLMTQNAEMDVVGVDARRLTQAIDILCDESRDQIRARERRIVRPSPKGLADYDAAVRFVEWAAASLLDYFYRGVKPTAAPHEPAPASLPTQKATAPVVASAPIPVSSDTRTIKPTAKRARLDQREKKYGKKPWYYAGMSESLFKLACFLEKHGNKAAPDQIKEGVGSYPSMILKNNKRKTAKVWWEKFIRSSDGVYYLNVPKPAAPRTHPKRTKSTPRSHPKVKTS